MARLPSKHDLSGPSSLRSGRAIASEDMSGLARGIQSFGASLGDMASRIESQHNAVDTVFDQSGHGAYSIRAFITGHDDHLGVALPRPIEHANQHLTEEGAVWIRIK